MVDCMVGGLDDMLASWIGWLDGWLPGLLNAFRGI
jgi:hypothetical protein